MVAIALDGHLDVCGITGGDLRLCHQEGRADLALEERVEPLPLLSLGAVLGDDFHVACVWGGAVGSLDELTSFFLSQLKIYHTSEAILLLPRYSAIRPYSRLLNPAPSLKCALGKNMFQSPSSRPRFFMSSMICGCAEKRSLVVSPSWRTYTASAGMHSSSTNFSTCETR